MPQCSGTLGEARHSLGHSPKKLVSTELELPQQSMKPGPPQTPEPGADAAKLFLMDWGQEDPGLAC